MSDAEPSPPPTAEYAVSVRSTKPLPDGVADPRTGGTPSDMGGCLGAFLEAAEEEPVRFAGAFTALDPAERLRVLLCLGSPPADSTEDGVAPAAERTPDPAQVGLLFDALDAEQARLAVVQRTLRLPEPSRRVWKGRPALPGDEELEVIDLNTVHAVHTGGVTDLFSSSPAEADDIEAQGAARGETGGGALFRHITFDNFLAPEEVSGEWQALGKEVRAVGVCGGRAPTPPSIDDFLRVDSPTGSAAGAGGAGEAPAPPPRADEAMERPAVGHCDPYGTSMCDEDVLSSVSSVELPGLGVDVDEGETRVPPFDPTSRSTADIMRQLGEVVSATDDCVHAFELDPSFDYDGDLLGEAFRTQRSLECGRL